MVPLYSNKISRVSIYSFIESFIFINTGLLPSLVSYYKAFLILLDSAFSAFSRQY